MLVCFRACINSNGLGAAGRADKVVWSSARHLGANCPRWMCLGAAREEVRAMSVGDVEAMRRCR